MRKWIVEAGRDLLVASVEKGPIQDNSAFSFQVTNARVVDIANGIEKLILMRGDPDEYICETSINCGNVSLYKFSGPNCSIVVNNCRVVYHGDIDRLRGLPSAIRKSYKQFDLED